MEQICVQRYTTVLGEGPHELLGQTGVKTSNFLVRHSDAVMQERPIGDIDDNTHQRLIHGYITRAVTLNAALIAERLSNCLTKAYPDVFDGVVIVYLNIATGPHLQVEEAVHGKERQHVIKKRYG